MSNGIIDTINDGDRAGQQNYSGIRPSGPAVQRLKKKKKMM